ncbi:MAG: hypothetical protein MHM6MM_001224 [Cercozoa sp. M6MM]
MLKTLLLSAMSLGWHNRRLQQLTREATAACERFFGERPCNEVQPSDLIGDRKVHVAADTEFATALRMLQEKRETNCLRRWFSSRTGTRHVATAPTNIYMSPSVFCISRYLRLLRQVHLGNSDLPRSVRKSGDVFTVDLLAEPWHKNIEAPLFVHSEAVGTAIVFHSLPTVHELQLDQLFHSLESRLSFLAELCEAVAHSHRNGVVHRGITDQTVRVRRLGLSTSTTVSNLNAALQGSSRQATQGSSPSDHVSHLSPVLSNFAGAVHVAPGTTSPEVLTDIRAVRQFSSSSGRVFVAAPEVRLCTLVQQAKRKRGRCRSSAVGDMAYWHDPRSVQLFDGSDFDDDTAPVQCQLPAQHLFKQDVWGIGMLALAVLERPPPALLAEYDLLTAPAFARVTPSMYRRQQQHTQSPRVRAHSASTRKKLRQASFVPASCSVPDDTLLRHELTLERTGPQRGETQSPLQRGITQALAYALKLSPQRRPSAMQLGRVFRKLAHWSSDETTRELDLSSVERLLQSDQPEDELVRHSYTRLTQPA